MEIRYKPDGETLKAFFKSSKFFRGVRGPVGSGKSAACCVEIFRRAAEQSPAPDGIRYSRWAVVRNTNPQLKTTTIKTWLQWFPEEVFGRMNWSPPYTHHIKWHDIDLEVIFLSLDKPQDVRKLLSLELTGVFFNEARELPKSIIDAGTMRVGRYPSMKDGGSKWYGIIADTNAPDDDHWWPIISGEVPPPDWMTEEEVASMVKPDDWEIFTQPGAMLPLKNGSGQITGYRLNPDAENLKNLDPSYYTRIIAGKDPSWIAVYVCNQYGTTTDGKPVYSEFNPALHVAAEELQPVPGVPLSVGIDFGLTPSAIVGQKLPSGRWLILREFVMEDMGARRFGRMLHNELQVQFPDSKIESLRAWGDPAGDYRAQTDETTPFQMLKAENIMARPAPSNDPVVRIESVKGVLNLLIDGKAGILIDPRCRILIKGFQNGYHYKRIQSSGAARYTERPEKNRFSHPHDALQYLILSEGGMKTVLGRDKTMRPTIAKTDFSVWDRHDRKAQKRESIWSRHSG